jgi:CRISPR system Cascade subunit CasD
MQVVSYVLKDRHGLPRPREPMLRDFHMVGSGYDDRDPWQSLLIPKTNEGKKAVGGGTKITYRYYLQDMAFAVAMQAPVAHVKEVTEALVSPVWDLYLGRKNCVPTEFIYQGLFDSAAQAVQAGEALAAEKNRAFALRVLQGEHDGEVLTLNDVPLQFGEHKKYRDRRVTVQKWE